MLKCNGSHVLINVCRKRGTAVYECKLEIAAKLLEDLLAERPDLAKLAKLANKHVPVRPLRWLTKALVEVRDLAAKPIYLPTVLHGRAAKDKAAEDLPRISDDMQRELVFWAFKADVSITELESISIAAAEEAWKALSFLAPARARVGDLTLVSDSDYETGRELSLLLNDPKWKETAQEARVVANHYCPLFNDWGSGYWSVEPILKLEHL